MCIEIDIIDFSDMILLSNYVTIQLRGSVKFKLHVTYFVKSTVFFMCARKSLYFTSTLE